MVTFIVVALILMIFVVISSKKKIKNDKSTTNYYLTEVVYEIDKLKNELENRVCIRENSANLSSALFKRVILTIKKGAQVQGQDYISLKFDRLIGNTNLISLHEEEMSKISDFIVRAINEGNDINWIENNVIERYKDYLNPYLLQSV